MSLCKLQVNTVWMVRYRETVMLGSSVYPAHGLLYPDSLMLTRLSVLCVRSVDTVLRVL